MKRIKKVFGMSIKQICVKEVRLVVNLEEHVSDRNHEKQVLLKRNVEEHVSERSYEKPVLPKRTVEVWVIKVCDGKGFCCCGGVCGQL